MTNDYYDDDENLLEEIIQQEQQGSLRRKLNNEALENGEEYRYILTEYLNNWTIFYWVLKRKLSRSLSRTSSSRCCIINCCMNSWLRISDSRICWRWSFWNSIIWSDKLFFGFSLTHPSFPLILFYRDLCWEHKSKLFSLKPLFDPE